METPKYSTIKLLETMDFYTDRLKNKKQKFVFIAFIYTNNKI